MEHIERAVIFTGALLSALIGFAAMVIALLLLWRARPATGRPLLGRMLGAFVGLVLLLGLAGAALLVHEVRTSRLQAWSLSKIGARCSFSLQPGPSDAIQFPRGGPVDLLRGHDRIPDILDRLPADEWQVTAQARWSPSLLGVAERGLFPPYVEKPQAGLLLLDRRQIPIFQQVWPRRAFGSFDQLPPLVVDTLLFLENRELLSQQRPFMNPAVEWDRLALAVGVRAFNKLGIGGRGPGGSTLATQLEKFRHSQEGITWSVREKLRQIASASLRAYQGGELTMAARQRIVTEYINSIPLAARPGIGAVHGLADSLEAWYGADPDRVIELLRPESWAADDPLLDQRALAYRQVLSLFLAQKRPTYYLAQAPVALRALTDAHLRLMGRGGQLPEPLWRAALQARLEPGRVAIDESRLIAAGQKATTSFRARLLPLLGLERLYDLDRMDLTAHTTLDAVVQRDVAELLEALDQPAVVEAMKLRTRGLVGDGDPAQIVYSFTLFEREADRNVLRVQADSLSQALDLNESSRLELGSTAKLRTLVTYLEIVAELHARLTSDTAPAHIAEDEGSTDPIAAWLRAHLAKATDPSLEAALEAALDRVYSASPREVFFTAGGEHRFNNYSPRDDDRRMSLREAFFGSVNLPLVRVMRDVVSHYIQRLPEAARRTLRDPDGPDRQAVLARFVEQESRVYLRRFYTQQHPRSPMERLEALTERAGARPTRVAAMLRAVRPDMSAQQLVPLLRALLPSARLSEAAAARLLGKFEPAGLSWADRGYLAGLHPLELWLVEHLERFARSSLTDVVEASRDVRRDIYKWLMTSRRRAVQDQRIRSMLEAEAFFEISRDWQQLGYPFDALVPSLATALGSSGDRPVALAELIGIIINDGLRLPTVRVEELHLAADTPYETHVTRGAGASEQVMTPAVARALRPVLLNVVERGTAQRAKGAFTTAAGAPLPVGGKTGTGDNRRKRFGSRGEVVGEVVVNRTATFVFHIGDRFFGTVVAYVPGPAAAQHRFTSALPTQVLRQLAPALAPLFESE